MVITNVVRDGQVDGRGGSLGAPAAVTLVGGDALCLPAGLKMRKMLLAMGTNDHATLWFGCGQLPGMQL